MRLGSRRTYFQVKDCKSAKLYGNEHFIDERHRHRYEVNPDKISQLESYGMLFTGKDESGQRMEIIELPDHPFYVGAQFHPEFKSRPGNPSPLFVGLIAAATGQLDFFLDNPNIVHSRLRSETPTCHLPPSTRHLPNGVHRRHDNGSLNSSSNPHANSASNGICSVYANEVMNDVYQKHLNGSANGIDLEHANGSTNGINPPHANGSMDGFLPENYGSFNGIRKDNENGLLNGVVHR